MGPAWDSYMCVSSPFKWAFSVPELGTNWVLIGSFMGCFVGPNGLPTRDPSAPFGHPFHIGPNWASPCVG